MRVGVASIQMSWFSGVSTSHFGVCVLCCAVVVRPMYIQYTCMYKGVYSGFLAKLVCTLFFNLRLRLAL